MRAHLTTPSTLDLAAPSPQSPTCPISSRSGGGRLRRSSRWRFLLHLVAAMEDKGGRLGHSAQATGGDRAMGVGWKAGGAEEQGAPQKGQPREPRSSLKTANPPRTLGSSDPNRTSPSPFSTMISPRPTLSSQSSGFFSRSASFSRPASFSPKPTSSPPSPLPQAPTPLSAPFSRSASFSRPATFSRSASFSASATASAVAVAAPDRAAASSFYDVLGLHAGASGREIKAAYRRLARAVHPDVSTQPAASAEDFIRVHAAYSTLSDPNKRADYDRRMIPSAVGRRRAPNLTRSPTFPGSRRRTWETDQCW